MINKEYNIIAPMFYKCYLIQCVCPLPMQMRYEGDVGVLIADGKNFSLKQVHWHSPSEHRINGEQYSLSLSLSLTHTHTHS
jgi:carbonic anhydrase